MLEKCGNNIFRDKEKNKQCPADVPRDQSASGKVTKGKTRRSVYVFSA